MPIGAPLAVAAVTVLAALLARLGVLRAASNRRALELIAQGREELPVEAVVRVRQRLLDPANRERLARALDVIRAEAGRPPGECHAIPSLYSVPVVRAVSSELGELAVLVRRSGGVRGLAATEQMVTDGHSPLTAPRKRFCARSSLAFGSCSHVETSMAMRNGDRSPFPGARRSPSLGASTEI